MTMCRLGQVIMVLGLAVISWNVSAGTFRVSGTTYNSISQCEVVHGTPTCKAAQMKASKQTNGTQKTQNPGALWY